MRARLERRLALQPPGIHPALWRFAGECHGFFAGLLSYMGALALIAIAALGLWDGLELRPGDMAAPPDRAADARGLPDSPAKAAAYETSLGRELSRQVSLLGLRGGL
jgi:predicted small lipoprotein YifL